MMIAEIPSAVDDALCDNSEQVKAARSKKAAKNKAKKARKRLKQPLTTKISFGSIEMIEFSLNLGLDAVPSIGSYPLGLGEETSTFHFDTIDEYEAYRSSGSEMVTGRKYRSDPIEEAERIALFHSYHESTSSKDQMQSRASEKGKHELSDLNKELKHIRESRNRSVSSFQPS